MDYEKKYKDALERARALHDEAIAKGYALDYVKDYEAIFPELAESEDEDEDELNLLKEIQNYHKKYLAGLYITFAMYKRIARYFYFLGKKQK